MALEVASAQLEGRLGQLLDLQMNFQGSVQNLFALGPARAITGPAVRGDQAAVNAQTEFVSQWHLEAGALKQRLSVFAHRLATKGLTTLAKQAEPPGTH